MDPSSLGRDLAAGFGELAEMRSRASRFFAWLLWLHVPIVAVIALSNGRPAWVFAALMCAAATAGTLVARRGGGDIPARCAIAGLLTLAPILMVFAGAGSFQIDWHMYFFVVFGMLVAYVDWRPLIVSATLTLAHHAVLGFLFPGSVFAVQSVPRVALHGAIVLVDILVLLWIVVQMRRLFGDSASAVKTAQDALAEALMFRSALAHASDGVLIHEMSMAHGESVPYSSRLIYVNEAFARMTGFTIADAVEGRIRGMFGPKTDVRSMRAHFRAASRGEMQRYSLIVYRKDGSELEVEVALSRVDPGEAETSHAISVIRDVAESRRIEAALRRAQSAEESNAVLEHTAHHDALTNLPNRALFYRRLSAALKLRPGSASTAVLFIDLDGFKSINDALGHQAGDELLVAFARRIERRLRTGELLGRISGDEFTILLEHFSEEANITALARRVLDALSEPFELSGHQIHARVSIGIAIAPAGEATADDIMRNADLAMYRAKSLGGARYQFFTPELRAIAERHLKIERELRGALERGELNVDYQPIVDAATRRPRGFEALVRWQHAEDIVDSTEVISVAESSGSIVDLGAFVLEQACRQLRSWLEIFPAHPELWVSLNVSPLQLKEPDFARTVIAALERNELEGNRLHLEITETTIVGDLEAVTPALARLREYGVRIVVDDFATGYSSLGYLDHLPIDALKIDRSFISGRGGGIANLKIVQIVVNLARELELSVIAGGVETEEQADTLRWYGVLGQGTWFGSPLEASEAERYLESMLPELRPTV